jgi:Flp pilus assembly protein TadG
MRRSRSRGGAAIEFALVLPVFLLVVFGAVEYGYYFWSEQIVTAAAREGARAGTTVDPDDGTDAARSAAMAVARNYMTAAGLQPQGVNATPTTVLGMTAIEVDISYTFKGLTGFGALVVPSAVHATSVFRWQ